MVQFFYITQSTFDGLNVSNKLVEDHLYFIENGKRLYRGAELIASSGEADADLQALEKAILESNKAISANANSITSMNELITAHIVVTDEMQKIIEALNSNKADKDSVYTKEEVDKIDNKIIDLSNTVSTNYDESIISLSIDGRIVTYIKGDGSTHSFETQDTDTTYSLGTDTVTGLTKLYATTGSAEDGTMTQRAIKTELDKKVGVSIDSDQNMLVFTI